MSTKKQLRAIDKLLEQGHDIIMKGAGFVAEVKSELNDLMEEDLDKASEMSGAVATSLDTRADDLSNVVDILDGAIDEIETATRDILYALQDLT